MSRRFFALLTMVLILALPVLMPAHARAQTGQTDKKVKLLAAAQNLQRECNSYSYDVAEQTVRQAVETRLRSTVRSRRRSCPPLSNCSRISSETLTCSGSS